MRWGIAKTASGGLYAVYERREDGAAVVVREFRDDEPPKKTAPKTRLRAAKEKAEAYLSSLQNRAGKPVAKAD